MKYEVLLLFAVCELHSGIGYCPYHRSSGSSAARVRPPPVWPRRGPIYHLPPRSRLIEQAPLRVHDQGAPQSIASLSDRDHLTRGRVGGKCVWIGSRHAVS